MQGPRTQVLAEGWRPLAVSCEELGLQHVFELPPWRPEREAFQVLPLRMHIQVEPLFVQPCPDLAKMLIGIFNFFFFNLRYSISAIQS